MCCKAQSVVNLQLVSPFRANAKQTFDFQAWTLHAEIDERLDRRLVVTIVVMLKTTEMTTNFSAVRG